MLNVHSVLHNISKVKFFAAKVVMEKKKESVKLIN